MKKLAFLLILVPLYACSSSQAGDADGAEVARLSHIDPTITEVGTVPVLRGDFELELMSNGKLESHRRAVVPFVAQEQILSVTVREGQRVSAGQTLGRVDPFIFQKRLTDAVNSYEQASIDLEDRLLGYGYALSDSSSVPENILKMSLIRSGYNNAVSSLKEAERNLAQTTITSPINGTIANLQAAEHNHSSSFPYFCEILDMSTMFLKFHLLETEIEQVKIGQQVELFPFALPGQSFFGSVTSINPAVDDKGMVRVTATISNPEHRLLDGMNARVLLKNKIPDCLIIPKEAVLYRQNRHVVFIYENNKAIWTYVKQSHENSSHVAIAEGLEEGMEVIIENNLNLAHDAEVTKSLEF